MTHNDYEKEPVRGLPARLPQGEHIVWQGAPDRARFLQSVLHVRKIALYFGVLIAWRIGAGLYDGSALTNIAITALWLSLLGAIVLGLIWWYARSVERTSVYTITNKRVVMRFGVALPITFNYPFSQIVSAGVQRLHGGSGTIVLSLKEHTKISWMVLWPHARPWKLAKPQPAIRLINDVDSVAQVLAESLSAAHDLQPVKITRAVEETERRAPRLGTVDNLHTQGA